MNAFDVQIQVMFSQCHSIAEVIGCFVGLAIFVAMYWLCRLFGWLVGSLWEILRGY